MTGRVEVVADVRADVGEGPAWDDATQTLTFVDVSPGAVYRLAPDTGTVTRFHAGQEVSAALPRSGGGLVLAGRDGILTCDNDGGDLTLVTAIDADDPTIRLNDGKCDPRGRLWVGSMAFDFAAGRASLFRVDASGPTVVLEDCTISNGLGWSPSGAHLYFVDSADQSIDVLDYDLETGTASGRRPFIHIDPLDGMPDGLSIDVDGGIWVALFGSGEVRRYDPTGTLTERVAFPAKQVTSCCFGGPGLTDLYVTSATYELGAADFADQPLAGATFRVPAGISGMPMTPSEL